MQTLVMTIIGDDRPGLVEALSSRIEAAGGNWLESRMSRLAGQFAGILRVQIADGAADGLVSSIEGLGAEGLQVAVRQSGEEPAAAADMTTVRLELVGQDRPGIVRNIASVISARGVNVEDLHTGCESAPMSGEPLFKVTAKLGLPDGLSMADLTEAIEAIASDLMVDVSLEADA
ncbi:MAG: glycine cleavage system regulatory protein [Verrucomicrobiales bacterium]|jgi:glycine cleavage system regulatory protein